MESQVGTAVLACVVIGHPGPAVDSRSTAREQYFKEARLSGGDGGRVGRVALRPHGDCGTPPQGRCDEPDGAGW